MAENIILAYNYEENELEFASKVLEKLEEVYITTLILNY